MLPQINEFLLLLLNIVLVYLKNILKWILPKDEQDLNGQVVVITGSAQGLGREMALLLHKLGAKLALIDINQSLNDELVGELNGQSKTNQVIGYKCDLTDVSDVEEVVGQILLDFGHVDILINNAGIVKCAPLLELNKQDIRRTFDVNVFSHFWLIKQFLPQMIERKSGHIVAISSIAGIMGTANLVDYCASKHAIVGMMSALDCELRSLNHDFIKLTTVCPLAIATGMFKRPKTRFNCLLPILIPEHVAQKIVDSIRFERTGLFTIPGYVLSIPVLQRIIPEEVSQMLQKYFGYEVDKH